MSFAPPLPPFPVPARPRLAGAPAHAQGPGRSHTGARRPARALHEHYMSTTRVRHDHYMSATRPRTFVPQCQPTELKGHGSKAPEGRRAVSARVACTRCLGGGRDARPTGKRASFMRVVLGLGSVVVSHECVFRPREPDGCGQLARPLRNSPDAPPGSLDYRRSASAVCPIWAHEMRRRAHYGVNANRAIEHAIALPPLPYRAPCVALGCTAVNYSLTGASFEDILLACEWDSTALTIRRACQ